MSTAQLTGNHISSKPRIDIYETGEIDYTFIELINTKKPKGIQTHLLVSLIFMKWIELTLTKKILFSTIFRILE